MADLYPAQPDEASHNAKPPTPADLNAEKATLLERSPICGRISGPVTGTTSR